MPGRYIDEASGKFAARFDTSGEVYGPGDDTLDWALIETDRGVHWSGEDGGSSPYSHHDYPVPN